MENVVCNNYPEIPRPNNMGVVRYVLAFAVLIAHFNELAGCDLYFPVSSFDAVGGFFALSGFLIYRSYMCHPGLLHYIGRRALRILPAYFATVIIFAIGLVFVSCLSAGEYFGSAHFWKYLLANLGFANFLEPTLPCVFTNNYLPFVNGSLWTMKVEWALYLSVPCVVWLLKYFKWREPAACIVIYVLSAIYRIIFILLYAHTGQEIYSILGRQFFGQMMYFYSGVLIYLFLSGLRQHSLLWLVSGVSMLALARYDVYTLVCFQPMGISLLVLWFSMIGRWGTKEGLRDNVSYNIYLLHFPIIQLVVSCPGMIQYNMWFKFFIVIVAVVVASVLLNRCVESPVRKFFMRKNSLSGK